MAIEFRELSWEDLKPRKVPGAFSTQELSAWGILFMIVLLAGIAFFTIRSMLLTDAELADMFAPANEWLNRCDQECASVINIRRIHGQTTCEGVGNLYRQPPSNHVFQWLLALDDRASYLACPGFPRTLEQLREETAAVFAKREEDLERERKRREEERLRLEKLKPERFGQSLKDGGLERFVTRYDIDENNENIMHITISPLWLVQGSAVQIQTASVLWQKWANIYSPHRPEDASITLTYVNGSFIGSGRHPTELLPVDLTVDPTKEEEDNDE